jgi:hypothetical protein
MVRESEKSMYMPFGMKIISGNAGTGKSDSTCQAVVVGQAHHDIIFHIDINKTYALPVFTAPLPFPLCLSG